MPWPCESSADLFYRTGADGDRAQRSPVDQPARSDHVAVMTQQTRFVEANGQSLFTRLVGDPAAPFVLFLHGFPEYGGAWESILPAFADRYFAAAPDQRGYNLSSKPVGIEHYKAQHLAADMFALADALAPGKPIHLVGHDWGASIAYMMAFLQPQRIAKLAILNGVHPVPFQRALINDPEQRAASQYIRFLRRDDAAALLGADGCQRTLQFLTAGFGGGRWLTDALRETYLKAWQQPGALEGMVSWYKATPMLVPAIGEDVAIDPIARMPVAMMRIRMPHLLLWGGEDKALRPSCTDGLEAFCDNSFKRVDIAGADHWIVHQHPDRVVTELRTFIGA
jgi:epoxide hydrolase 4